MVRHVIGRRSLIGCAAAASVVRPAPLFWPAPAEAASRSTRQTTDGPQAALPLVVLDPGHGGKDPGAIGLSGTFEKHVALAAAQEVRRQLESTHRVRVALTRGGDRFIPLERRVALAQARGAALFISLHADALADREVRGASVYTLAEGASDPQTAALARRENAADRFGGSAFQGVPPEVAGILASLVRQETRAGSTHLAHSLVGTLGREVGLLPNPSRHASFVVLKAPDIPSVLVEMGFMSNRRDEAALQQAQYRAQIASAVARAVLGVLAPAGAPRATG